VELAPHDPATARVVWPISAPPSAVPARLELAQERGELARMRDVRALARYLVSAM